MTRDPSTAPGLGALFVRNPRLVVLVVGLALVAGLGALQAIPRQEDPTLTGRFATIQTRFAGATPERVEALVTDPMEDALRDIEEIKEVTSTSRTGFSVLSIELDDLVTKVEPVWSRVRDRMADVAATLPAGAAPPEFERQYPEAHALIVGLSWPDTDPATTEDARLGLLARLSEALKERLERLPGVKAVDLFGLPDEEITVAVDPLDLAQLGLTPEAIASALAAADARDPAGALHGPHTELTLEVAGAFSGVDRVRAVPLREDAAGPLLRVGDVARVTRGERLPPDQLALVDGRRGVLIGVKMEGGLRVDRWAERVSAEVVAFSATVPDALAVEILFDQSRFTADRLSGLVRNLALGVSLVMAVLWVMMGWRSALIVGSALPLTLTTVVFLLFVLGVPLHQISVTGLIIALGLLIDNAIVAIDDYDRRRARGHGPVEAVAGLTRHLAVPLLASTVTSVLTFAPMLLMPGPTGEFVGTMALSVILSIAASLFYALTVVPAVAAFLDQWAERRIGAGAGAASATGQPPGRHGLSLPRLTQAARAALCVLMRRPRLAMLLAALPAGLGFALTPTLPGQFFPPVDRAQFQIQLAMPAHASLAETRAAVARVNALLAQEPLIRRAHWVVGGNPPKVFYNTIFKGEADPSFAGAFVDTASAEATRALLPRLQAALMAALPEAEVLAIPFEQGPPFDAPVEVEIYGPDIQILRALGEEIRALLAATPGVTYTRTTLAGGHPTVTLAIDEDEARAAGFALNDIAAALAARQEGVTGGMVLEGTERLPVRVRAIDARRGGLADLAAAPLPRPQASPASDGAQGGSAIALDALGHLTLTPGVTTIPRFQGERRNRVQGFLVPYVLPSETLAAFRARLEAADIALPAGYRLDFGGESRESAESQSKLGASLMPLLVILFGVLVLAFNSFRQALVLGGVAGLAMGMAFLSVWVFGYPFGFMVLVGAMGLIGIAINDSIVILSALRVDPAARRGEVEAVVSVILDGSRHVLSTTLTTIGGFLPLILFGEVFWAPLAVAVSGGMVGATLLALVFVPAAFVLIAGVGARRRARWRADVTGRGEVAGAVASPAK